MSSPKSVTLVYLPTEHSSSPMSTSTVEHHTAKISCAIDIGLAFQALANHELNVPILAAGICILVEASVTCIFGIEKEDSRHQSGT
jgi:hypothetical protein